MNYVGDGVGSLAYRRAIHLEIGVLRGDGLAQVLRGRQPCGVMRQQGSYGAIAAAGGNLKAVAYATIVRGQGGDKARSRCRR